MLARKNIILSVATVIFILGAFSFSSASNIVLVKSQKKMGNGHNIVKADAAQEISLQIPSDGLKIPDNFLNSDEETANNQKAANQLDAADQQPTPNTQPQTPAQPAPVTTPTPSPVQAQKSESNDPKVKNKDNIQPVAAKNQELAYNFTASKIIPQAIEKSTQILIPTAQNWPEISSKSPYATDAFSQKTTRVLNSIAVLLGLFGLWMYVLSLPVRGRQPENSPVLSYAE